MSYIADNASFLCMWCVLMTSKSLIVLIFYDDSLIILILISQLLVHYKNVLIHGRKMPIIILLKIENIVFVNKSLKCFTAVILSIL